MNLAATDLTLIHVPSLSLHLPAGKVQHLFQGPVFTGVKGLYFAHRNNHSTSPHLEGAGGGGGPPGWNLNEPHTFGPALLELCSPIPGLAWMGEGNGGTNGGIDTPRDPQGG